MRARRGSHAAASNVQRALVTALGLLSIATGVLLLAACSTDRPTQIASAQPVSTTARASFSGESATRPLNTEARALQNALAGHVLITAFTNPQHSEGVAEAVYYGKDGTGMVDRLAARAPSLQPFRWDVRTKQTSGARPYIFISGDGRDDGAAVSYSSERRSVAFSDAKYGPYFSFGVIQGCWPGFVASRPTGIQVCDPATDSVTLRRLANEHQVVAALRANTRPNSEMALFTTKPGAVYTNSMGNAVTVKSVDGLRVTFVNQNGGEFASHALLYSANPKVTGNEDVFRAIDRLWPLAIGNTAEAWVYNADWAWQLQWKVARRETITVPAGTFDAWCIEHTETAIGAGYIGKSDTCYAPAVGWNVRYRNWVETPPGGARSEWTLTDARVPSS